MANRRAQNRNSSSERRNAENRFNEETMDQINPTRYDDDYVLDYDSDSDRYEEEEDDLYYERNRASNPGAYSNEYDETYAERDAYDEDEYGRGSQGFRGASSYYEEEDYGNEGYDYPRAGRRGGDRDEVRDITGRGERNYEGGSFGSAYSSNPYSINENRYSSPGNGERNYGSSNRRGSYSSGPGRYGSSGRDSGFSRSEGYGSSGSGRYGSSGGYSGSSGSEGYRSSGSGRYGTSGSGGYSGSSGSREYSGSSGSGNNGSSSRRRNRSSNRKNKR